jgi:hypothetical protein
LLDHWAAERASHLHQSIYPSSHQSFFEMPQQAQVTSHEAIELFRSQLIVFLSKARPALEEVSGEVHRLRQWLQTDQRRNWEKELKIRRRRLEEAQAELFSAKLSKLQAGTTLPFMAMQRAQRAVQEAEAKLDILKKWDRELDNRTDPLVKQIEQTHGYLTTDGAKAIAHLAQIIKSLEAYANVLAPGISSGATATPQQTSEAASTPDTEAPNSQLPTSNS